MRRGAVAVAIGAAAVAAGCSERPGPVAPEAGAVPQLSAGAAAGPVIPGRFIVTLRPGTRPADVARGYGVRPDFIYRSALNGFAGSIADAARSGLLRDGRVLRIEPDQVMRAVAVGSWGLDRIDQRQLPLDGSYTPDGTGTGVTAYIIDTGILFDHTEFGGRATSGYDFVDNDADASDCNGHGTHVAGTVGGATYGVAKSAKLVAVRVLDCQGSGTTSGVIAGVDWVTQNHVDPAVANMSLGGGASTALDDAVRNSIASGVTYAIAAGNGDFLGRAQDACKSSPARVAEAVTVSATDNTDTKASWANYGTCVDIFAPGVNITSSWYSSTTATNTISGTSMATPHVAGAAALVLERNPAATPAAVADSLENNATPGVVKSPGSGSPNLLLYVGTGGASPPPPSANITLSTRGYTSRNKYFVDLSWSGATSTSVDVYRNGSLRTTTANDGAYTDNLGRRASGTYTYKVCEAGTTTCSNNSSVAF